MATGERSFWFFEKKEFKQVFGFFDCIRVPVCDRVRPLYTHVTVDVWNNTTPGVYITTVFEYLKKMRLKIVLEKIRNLLWRSHVRAFIYKLLLLFFTCFKLEKVVQHNRIVERQLVKVCCAGSVSVLDGVQFSRNERQFDRRRQRSREQQERIESWRIPQRMELVLDRSRYPS